MWKNVQEQEYPSESHEFEPSFEYSVIDDDCGTAAIKLCGLGGQVSHEDPEADLLRGGEVTNDELAIIKGPTGMVDNLGQVWAVERVGHNTRVSFTSQGCWVQVRHTRQGKLHVCL